jgi:hypothetical protein
VIEEKQRELIAAVMEMIDTTLNLYKEDEHHAPAAWLLENWWATLAVVLNLSSSSLGVSPSILLEFQKEACSMDENPSTSSSFLNDEQV